MKRVLRRLLRLCAAAVLRVYSALARPFLGVPRSSVSDWGWYPELCARAASDDELFSRFRSDIRLRLVFESTPAREAREHLRRVLRQTPHYVDLLERFRAGDRIGSPETADFPPHGLFAPNTLRHLRTLSDCEARFGSLDGATIAEIGVGYGGLCLLFLARFAVGRYLLIDLPGALRLSRRFLEEALGPETVRDRVRFIEAARGGGERLGAEASGVDLAVSTFAFSECRREVQEEYLRAVLAPARRGYLKRNEISRDFGVDSMTLEELRRRLPPELEVEADESDWWDDRVQLLWWGRGAQPGR